MNKKIEPIKRKYSVDDAVLHVIVCKLLSTFFIFHNERTAPFDYFYERWSIFINILLLKFEVRAGITCSVSY